MTEEDIIKLVHQVQGQQEVNEMRVALERNIESLRTLNVVEVNYDQRQASMQAQVKKSAAQFLEADAALKKAGGGMAGFGQSMMQAGRSVQDFQAAGLPGILNNIEGLAMAMGGGAGLAGTLTLAAVAFQTFSKEIKAFWNEMTGAGIRSVDDLSDSLAGLEGQIKELEEKPTKVALDLQMLDAAKDKLEGLKRSAAAFEATKTTTAEADFTASVQKMLKETRGSAGLASSIAEVGKTRPDLVFDPTKAEGEIKALEVEKQSILAKQANGEFVLGAEKRLGEIEKESAAARSRIPEEQKQQAVDMASRFAEGKVRDVGRVQGLARAVPLAFLPDMREALGEMAGSPGELARRTQEDKELEQFQKENLARAASADRMRARLAREEATRRQAKEREDNAFARRKAEEARMEERRQRDAAIASRRAGVAGMQATRQGAPEVAATIGEIGLGPVAAAKATQRALQQISAGNKNQMDAVMTAVQEVMNQANLMNFEQKAYAANFLRMAKQQRSRRTGVQSQ